MVWNQLDPDKAHVAYSCLGFFTFFFALVSSLVKDTIFFGDAPVSTLFGLIIGPHSLNWVNPLLWNDNNYLYNTLEISRILLCIELVTVGIDLPPKYLYHHGLQVLSLLSFAMIIGWVLFAAFLYIILPNYSYSWALLVSACVTATDPVLAQAIIGKSKFSISYVPNHLKNLLTSESACNDGLAVPFVYLALNIIIHAGNSNEIAKNFILITIFYECIFGCFIGFLIGYCSNIILRISKKYNFIDNESNIFFPLTIAFFCAGISPILGIDDLLTSFCAGIGLVWNGKFKKTVKYESFIDSLDIFLNISYFIYFGTIIPWDQFNNHHLGLDVWRLIIIGIVFLTLRRIPAVLMQYKFNKDIHSFKEALFVGHFGPIGVSGIFASILAISNLQSVALDIDHELISNNINDNVQFSLLINTIFPLVTFLVVVSILVHGSSASLIVLYKYFYNSQKKESIEGNENENENVSEDENVSDDENESDDGSESDDGNKSDDGNESKDRNEIEDGNDDINDSKDQSKLHVSKNTTQIQDSNLDSVELLITSSNTGNSDSNTNSD